MNRSRSHDADHLHRPPMLERFRGEAERSLAPAFAHLATLKNQMAAAMWLDDNDPGAAV